jgi:arsenate reductase (glutaredoxin)
VSIKLYGIPNCDTVKKARTWLDAQGHAYTFHDFKKEGVGPERLARWIASAGLDTVLNRRGTTYRALPDAGRAAIEAGQAVTVLQANPSMIKRPVVEHPGGLLIGFKEAEWRAALS